MEHQANYPHIAVITLNQYMGGIHVATQAAHAGIELARQLEDRVLDEDYARVLSSWCEHYKILWIKTGGMQSDLLERHNKLFLSAEKYGVQLPFAHFREEEDALNGTLTATIHVLPYLPEPEVKLYAPVAGSELIRKYEFGSHLHENLWSFQQEAMEIIPRKWAV